ANRGFRTSLSQDYEVDLYLRQRWYDGRLAKVNISAPLDLNDPKLVQKIWKPEVFFANAKHAEFQFVTVPNVLVRLTPHGMILYMLRLKLTFSCMMDLYRYPLDVQTCTIELASYPRTLARIRSYCVYSITVSKTTDELVLHWSERNPVILFENLKLPQFEIQNVSTSLCNETFYLGEYSCLKAEFHLQRSMGYHLVQSYLPTVLIVVISWVSFWLDVEAIPARITLGVTTLLTISSKGVGIQSNLPPVSYVKAIDVWMGVCTMFVFTALLEFTFVNYLWRKKPHAVSGLDSVAQQQQQQQQQGQHHPADIKTITTNNGGIQAATVEVVEPAVILAESRPRYNGQLHAPSLQLTHGTPAAQLFAFYLNCNQVCAKRIDRLSRIGFPSAFLVFCMIYWPYYLYVTN
ncbi:glycine receptor subunit alpha-2-like, partial [Tropilaelaps mercedesae]